MTHLPFWNLLIIHNLLFGLNPLETDFKLETKNPDVKRWRRKNTYQAVEEISAHITSSNSYYTFRKVQKYEAIRNHFQNKHTIATSYGYLAKAVVYARDEQSIQTLSCKH